MGYQSWYHEWRAATGDASICYGLQIKTDDQKAMDGTWICKSELQQRI